MRISYDKDADVLYITFSRAQERAAYLEINGGILRIEEKTKQVIGVTIPFFQEKTEEGKGLELPEIGGMHFTPVTEETIRQAKETPNSLHYAGR